MDEDVETPEPLALDAGTMGLLPDRWVDNGGIAFAEMTPDQRDFSEVQWSWRDPTRSLLPLMFQSVTAHEHDDARLAGFVEAISEVNGTVRASGGFYDNDAGREARDVLAAGGRFGVSVDPGAVTGEMVCTETDEDDNCVAEVAKFTAYEVIGLTMTPFPAFAEAAIRLASAEDAMVAAAEGFDPVSMWNMALRALPGTENIAAPVVASAMCQCGGPDTITVPHLHVEFGNGVPPALTAAAPPVHYFTDPHLAGPTPLTIDGTRVWGHLATFDVCHTSHPSRCVTAPRSQASYAYFTTGSVLCADGSRVKVGQLTMGCGHAPLASDARGAAAHYDGGPGAVQWADVAVGEDAHGIWVAGTLRPGLTESQVREAQAQALSGDWRNIGGHLELVAALSVPVPGFPIAASGLPEPVMVADAPDGTPLALVAAGVVNPVSPFASRTEMEALRAEVAHLRTLAAFRVPTLRPANTAPS